MKKTVLIVDDDESIRESLKVLLEHNYSPITVTSGEEALDKLNYVNIDAVLLDIKMGGIDGLETLLRIRERFKHVAVIMISVIDDANISGRAIKLGAKDYIYKPFAIDELLLSLRKNTV